MRMKLSGAWKKVGILLGAYLLLFLTVFFSKELSDGVRGGIDVCLNLLIPSMFVFLIVSNVLMSTPASRIMARPFRVLARHLFRIPEPQIAVVLLSLVGGYPVGAKLLADAVRNGRLDPDTAGRMLAFCVNCGPAFLISGVGVSLFGSLPLGGILYASQVIACCTVGFLSSRGKGRRAAKRERSSPSALPGTGRSASAVLVDAVHSAARSMGVICAFVVAFSALMPILSLLLSGLPADVSRLLQGLLEVTTGCQSLFAFESLDRVLLAALFTSFGGICVMVQICAMLRGSGIPLRRFFLWRIPYTLVSLLATRLLLHFLPGVAETMSHSSGIMPQLYSVSPTATIFLLLLCIMLLFFSGKSGRMRKSAVSR